LKSATSQVTLILETEEPLDLSWFEGIGVPSFGSKGTQELVLLTKDAGEARKAILQVVSQQHLSLIRLDQGAKNLETLFREITQGQ
jgi:ABC-2 type transport system ATP-binding protein